MAYVAQPLWAHGTYSQDAWRCPELNLYSPAVAPAALTHAQPRHAAQPKHTRAPYAAPHDKVRAGGVCACVRAGRDAHHLHGQLAQPFLP